MLNLITHLNFYTKYTLFFIIIFLFVGKCRDIESVWLM